jgi:hypothetical protein
MKLMSKVTAFLVTVYYKHTTLKSAIFNSLKKNS